MKERERESITNKSGIDLPHQKQKLKKLESARFDRIEFPNTERRAKICHKNCASLRGTLNKMKWKERTS